MSKILTGKAKVSRPSIMGEIKLVGLNKSISTDEVREAVASKGSCRQDEVKVG